MTTPVPPSAQSPDEGEMERLEQVDLFKNVSGKPYMVGTQLRNDYWERVNLAPIFDKIRSLHSRLKQVEEDRDSYMEDAEKMYDLLHNNSYDGIGLCNYCRSKKGDVHFWRCKLSKTLSSLFNHYPSNK